MQSSPQDVLRICARSPGLESYTPKPPPRNHGATEPQSFCHFLPELGFWEKWIPCVTRTLNPNWPSCESLNPDWTRREARSLASRALAALVCRASQSSAAELGRWFSPRRQSPSFLNPKRRHFPNPKHRNFQIDRFGTRTLPRPLSLALQALGF